MRSTDAALRTAAQTLRISSIDPVQAGPPEAWPALLHRVSGLGFDHLLLGSVFSSAASDPALVADTRHLAPALGGGDPEAALRGLAAMARAQGVSLLLDVTLDRVAAGSALASTASGLFSPPDPEAPLDPRRDDDMEAALARPQGAEDGARLGRWWAAQLAGWAKWGIAGFRLLGLDRLPAAHLADTLAALRQGTDAILLAWTPGVSHAALPSLRGIGLDGVFCSLPWWDWQSEWLWDEIAVLRTLAPVLASPEVPGGARLAASVQDPVAALAVCRRSLALAASLGTGWLVVAGMEDALPLPAAPPRASAPGTADLAPDLASDLTADISALNGLLMTESLLDDGGMPVLPLGATGPVLALLRADTDLRIADRVLLVLANADLVLARAVEPATVLPALGGRFGEFAPLLGTAPFQPGVPLVLQPGEIRAFAAQAVAAATSAPLDPAGAERAGHGARVAIENPLPAVDGGAFPVKRLAGESVTVTADILCDGHDKLAAALIWQEPSGGGGECRMRLIANDSWEARFPLGPLGRHSYRIQAWRDAFATFADELAKKYAAGIAIELEMVEGTRLVERAAARSDGPLAAGLAAALDAMQPDDDARRTTLLSPGLAALMREADDRPHAATSPAMPVDAERIGAGFASWYEVFPRSMSDDPARHGTFADVQRHLPRVQAMGFDVLYFPPIHPIGTSNRKGPNNTLTPGPTDPGSPYAVGSELGGHDALHPELGTLEDFRQLVAAASAHGLEIAIDFAIQCSPDHPWLKQHRGWFDWRPDGSIKYAENPPKKYQDIVNVDFYAEDAVPGLWVALCESVLFWAQQGIRLFRVDNPHTKPFAFWEWMIAEVRARYPDSVFLAEAFTRPKVMYRLAKVGFSQSYTYFTWRNEKRELQEYLTELSTEAPSEFFRPHFFVNTPDINPVFLQTSGRPGFLIRAALAATLSGLWGVYNGFELCEGTPLPGREEYLDSEKFQIRTWDWDRPGNIVAEITRLNRMRRANPALHSQLGVTFLPAASDAVLFFEKATPDRSNVVLVAVSLDPRAVQETAIDIPLYLWSLPDSAALDMEDLVGGTRFRFEGRSQRVRLAPDAPYAIWRATPA